MSYCRFGEADAYIYYDVTRGLHCAACSIMPVKSVYSEFFKKEILANQGFSAGDDYNKMLAHIAEHRDLGEYIPVEVDEELIRERDCSHEFTEVNNSKRCKKCWIPYTENQ